MIVVFLHATVEDLVRSELPERTKFTFSSGADIDKALRKAGFNPEPLKEIYPPLNMMARRRIAIVHHADLPPDAENVKAWDAADVWCLIQWNLAVIAFLYQLLSVVIEPADLFRRRYAAAKQAMHEHVAFGNMIRDLPNALRTATATSDTTEANNLLTAMQDKLTAVQKLVSFKEEAQPADGLTTPDCRSQAEGEEDHSD
jgi:hypothetical protein